MRLIFTTKIGAQFFLAPRNHRPLSFVRKSMYRYGFHAKRFADLEVAPEILRALGGWAGKLVIFFGWNFWQVGIWPSKGFNKTSFPMSFFHQLGKLGRIGTMKKNTRRTHQKKADDMSTDAAVPMVQWTWNKNMVGNPSDSFRWMPGFLQMPTSLVPGEMLRKRLVFVFFFGGGHKTSKLPVDQTHKTTWGQTQTHTHTHDLICARGQNFNQFQMNKRWSSTP